MKTLNTVALMIVSLMTGNNQVYAGSSEDEWQYEITPYMLAAGMDGTVGIRGHDADLNVSFSDIWDDLNSGFMGLFTAEKGPWIFALEGVYMKLEGDGSGTVTGPHGHVSVNGKLDITNSMYIAQGTAAYRVLNDKTKVSLLGALRYTEIDVDVDLGLNTTFKRPNGNISNEAANAFSKDDSESWTDAVVGLYVVHPVSDSVELTGYVDVGAGGSDLTYQFMGGVNWEFREGFRAKLGYRYLYWDYEDNGFKWDVDASGPYLGLGIRF